MAKFGIVALIGLLFTAGCSVGEPVRISANGMVKWTGGHTEGMHISQTGSSITFANYSNEVGATALVIFARIDSAKNDNCEYFYVETAVKKRLKVCETGEVTLFNRGKVVKVGHMVKSRY
ncbi:hypothetical protein [Photobacterium carnosum]|uniref:Lipoprotein n=1 Tax=Photobacterium carnosum TaxID=2023717 RepID=A0A2N4UY92_9GAMM|nr:hypothetical protein [Photobacterium carnosum]KAE8176638.1 hypothetical protein CIT27_12075 [Photobacterium carnosum]MBY3787220.1 hypothetical protein [Photobacterium carnosum]MCD9493686.1 hypothetical protein [Photobacterium carnosum]MCD9513707.1 hypothetical protein [Photobacterium carnosum]MCD9523186.1 hypothetical protein [Photobacterium carnosum]